MQILIIVGSNRPVRVGDQIAGFVADTARAVAGPEVEVELDDLRERDLPFLDEPVPPAMAGGTHHRQHSKEWADTVAGADAVVIVSPQYNAGYPAGLKNAIDYLWDEWEAKPLLLITYGTEFSEGGKHAREQLSQVLTAVRTHLHEPAVQLPLPLDAYGPDGRLVDPAATLAPFRELVADGITRLTGTLATR